MIFTLNPKSAPVITGGGGEWVGSFELEPPFTIASLSSASPQPIEIPDSFLRGLADCDAGRVVDMERAIEEPPPEAT
jgi:hypothetical protein